MPKLHRQLWIRFKLNGSCSSYERLMDAKEAVRAALGHHERHAPLAA